MKICEVFFIYVLNGTEKIKKKGGIEGIRQPKEPVLILIMSLHTLSAPTF